MLPITTPNAAFVSKHLHALSLFSHYGFVTRMFGITMTGGKIIIGKVNRAEKTGTKITATGDKMNRFQFCNFIALLITIFSKNIYFPLM